MVDGLIQTLADGVRVVQVRTPTLPPATHTNVVVLGRRSLVVIDPASPWEVEQRALLSALDGMGGQVQRIVLTHHHQDHVSGALALQAALGARGHRVPIAAHPVTGEWLEGVPVQEWLEDGDELAVEGEGSWKVSFTPGHAPGHIALWAPSRDWAVAGDLVAGIGTILIDPHDGDLGLYLDSLRRLRALGPERLIPSHGPVLMDGPGVLTAYLAHRDRRSDAIAAALSPREPATPMSLVASVYPDLDPMAVPLAALQIESHLRWLAAQGEAVAHPGPGGGETWWGV